VPSHMGSMPWTGTGGASAFKPEWAPHIADLPPAQKRGVVVCYDGDEGPRDAERAKEVPRTGVPGDRKAAHEIAADNPERVEKEVHCRLSSRRVSSEEFFEVPAKKTAREIERVAS